MNDRDRYFALFDAKGEEWTREQVTRKTFSEFKLRTAQAWLDQRDRISSKSESADTRRIARSAKNAAWIAAIAATVAAISTIVMAFLAFGQPPS